MKKIRIAKQPLIKFWRTCSDRLSGLRLGQIIIVLILSANFLQAQVVVPWNYNYKATAVMGYMTKGVRGQDTVIAVTPNHPIPMTLTNLEDFSFLVNRDSNIFVTQYQFSDVTNGLVPILQYTIDTSLAREYSDLLYQPADVYLVPNDTLEKWSAKVHTHDISDVDGLNDWIIGTGENLLNMFAEAGLTNGNNVTNVTNYVDIEVDKLKDSLEEVRTLANQNKIPDGNTGQVWKMLSDNIQGWGVDFQGEDTPDLDEYITRTELIDSLNNLNITSNSNNLDSSVFLITHKIDSTLKIIRESLDGWEFIKECMVTITDHGDNLFEIWDNGGTGFALIFTPNFNGSNTYRGLAKIVYEDNSVDTFQVTGFDMPEGIYTNTTLSRTGICYIKVYKKKESPLDSIKNNIVYTNNLLEEYLGYGTGYLFKCDTILKTESNFFSSVERDTTKRMIIDYLSIQTDSATIGYEISIKKLSTPTYSKIVFRNERLTGNVTVNFNLVGTPLVLQPDEHLYVTKFLTNGEVKAKAWLTVKYRLK